MKAPVEMVAAATGSYSSFQVPLHGSVAQLNVPVQVESSVAEYQQEESDLPAQIEVAAADSEFRQKSRALESKELQYHPRRSHQNYRGGRGGRVSGRGGYLNGQSQFYGQPSNYNSGNYNYRGSGGRGGNSNYHATIGYAGHVQAES
ncbi:unnamed protein product [Fraxinus pennsylvanica]|uniref:Uncharacterized protein n=1 Tax=Fraxinus pennsylvanica TaxID=56036 RepID=A0AAD1YSL8_9LAMI|nr:unnamed protein product [Fraxinus pennsylvanica]